MCWRPAVALLVILGTAGCGGGDGFAPNTIQPEEVAGLYNLTTLTFDPMGSLPNQNILARIDTTFRQLVVSLDTTFQLAFIDPTTQKIEPLEGKYVLEADGIELVFRTDGDAQLLLLPRRLGLDFDQQAQVLSFGDSVSVSLTRVRQLIPEFQNEPLSDPLPGDLVVVFRRRSTSQGEARE